MRYSKATKAELIERIEELETLNRELLLGMERETQVEFSWTGNLGRWYWNVKTNTVTIDPLKITALGYTKNEIPKKITRQFFTDKLHQDDYENTIRAMREHLSGKNALYETEYRIQTKNGKYRWYHDLGKITQYDKNGSPLLVSGVVSDITERKEAEFDLKYKNIILTEMAVTDDLTQICNRRALIAYLGAGMLTARRTDTPLSVAMFDIDNFKSINDSRGHAYGDRILIDVAAIIKKNAKASNLAGRYGGEEFLVIFPNSDLPKALKISEQIRQSIESHVFAGDVKITISGGVVLYNDEDLVELIDLADKKLYEAKKKGKNQIVF